MAIPILDIVRRFGTLCRRLSAVMLICTLPTCAIAREGQTLAQMDHAMWTARDGAPQGIHSLALGSDGTLWVGAESGLVNFDGRTFSPFHSPPGEPELPGLPVWSILVAKDGALWVGFFQGGVARIAQGRVTLYANVGDKPLALMEQLREGTDGSIWAIANQLLLVRFGSDGAWRVEPTPSTTRIGGIFIDSSNTLWLVQAGHLYRRPLSQASYAQTSVPGDVVSGFAETPEGNIWMADVETVHVVGRTQLIDRSGKLLKQSDLTDNPSSVVYASDGSLLMSLQNEGLRRFGSEEISTQSIGDSKAEPDVFSTQNGLSSNTTATALLDADGNIWVGGVRGLDRLRTAQLTPFVQGTDKGAWGVCASKQGELWIATRKGDLYRGPSNKRPAFRDIGDAYALSCADGGYAWVAIPGDILAVQSERLTHVPYIPGLQGYQLMGIVPSSDHSLYAMVSGIAANGGGIWQYKGGEWKHLPGEGVLGAAGFVAYIDAQDRLWIGYNKGRVILHDGNDAKLFTSGDPGIGVVFAILQTRLGIFAAGTNGLAVLRQSNFEMLSFADQTSASGVRGLVDSRNGDLWLNATRGVVHLPAGELERGLTDPAYRMKAELITEGEFAGARQAIGSLSTVARDGEGVLWFATRNGVFHLDPEHRSRPSRPPVVTIRSISADRNLLNTDGVLDPRPQTVAIQYLGVNLTAPEKVIYRYRLDGLDDAWQEAGSRTEALYTRLQPGTYTFRVMASNGDGVWSTPLLSRPFTVPPSFYQTAWFAALCVLAGALLLWLVFSMRVRAITRVVRARAEERADERIRIARELHDTLLQGIQGLLLNFHVVAQKMSPDDEAKPILERALSTADRIIVEGRNRVGSLRSEHVTDAELVGALRNAGNELNVDQKVQYSVMRTGISAALQPHVADEVFFAAREAVTNAFRHARASHVSLELGYGARYFNMVCKDDGRGFGPEEQERPGHWGLQGIAERAEKLGGQTRVLSGPGQGTEIILAIPSYLAYRGYSRLMFYLRAWRLAERSPLRRKPAPPQAAG